MYHEIKYRLSSTSFLDGTKIIMRPIENTDRNDRSCGISSDNNEHLCNNRKKSEGKHECPLCIPEGLLLLRDF